MSDSDRDRSRDTDHDVEHGPATPQVPPGPAGPGGADPAAAAAAPQAAAPAPAPSWDALLAAVRHRRLDPALVEMARDPAGAYAALETNRLTTAFFRVMARARPFTAQQRTQLDALYDRTPGTHKERFFESRFGIDIRSSRVAGGGRAQFTEHELDVLYHQSAQLPPGHVEHNTPGFRRLNRTQGATAEGSYSGTTINMDADAAGDARYTSVFRHEVGHGVDQGMGGTSRTFRLTTAGWHPYSSVASFIAAIGGYGDLARAEQNAVRDAIRAYMGPGSTFNAPTATFEDTLLATIRRRHRGVTELPDRSDAISTELDGIKAKYTTNALLKVAIASEGNQNYGRYQNCHSVAGKVFFINHWYAKGYSVAQTTIDDLRTWADQGAAQAAAFSDKEWFAEAYSVYYSSDPPGTSQAWAGWISTFFTTHVQTYRQRQTTARTTRGGGNPHVPR